MSIPELYSSLEEHKVSISLVDDIAALEERMEEYMDDNDSENILADIAVLEELMKEQHAALSSNEEVKERITQMIADARWHTLWLQSLEETAELFEEHFDMFFEYQWESVLHDIRDVLLQEEDLSVRDEWKARVRAAIEQSNYHLGDNLMIIDGQNEEPTIRNWFSAYREYVGDRDPDALSIVEFLNSSANSSLLTAETRTQLEGVLKLDLELHNSSATPEGLEEKLIIPDPNTGTYHIIDRGTDIDTGIAATEEELADIRAEMGINEDGTPMKISEQVKREVLGSRYSEAPVQVDEAPAPHDDVSTAEENEKAVDDTSVEAGLLERFKTQENQPEDSEKNQDSDDNSVDTDQEHTRENEEQTDLPKTVDFNEGLTIPVPPSISLHVDEDMMTSEMDDNDENDELEASAALEMEALLIDTEEQGQPVSFPEDMNVPPVPVPAPAMDTTQPVPEMEPPELPEMPSIEAIPVPEIAMDTPPLAPQMPELPPMDIPEMPMVSATEKNEEIPTVEAATTSVSNENTANINYKQVAQEVLSELQLLLESYAAEKRFLSLVTSYANGSIEKEEVTKQLSAAPEEGGVHLHPDQVEMVLQATDAMIEELVHHPRAAAAQVQQSVGGGMMPTLEMVEKQINRQKEMQEYKAEEQGIAQTEPEDDLVDIFANMNSTTAPQGPAVEEDAVLERLRTEAPVEMKELPHPEMMGPMEELEHFTVEEFRRLGQKNIQDAVKEISEAIHLLAEESIQRKADGIDAWKRSPLNQLYIAIGNESFNQAVPVTDVIAQRQAQGIETLSEDEFHAIADLNSHLRF